MEGKLTVFLMLVTIDWPQLDMMDFVHRQAFACKSKSRRASQPKKCFLRLSRRSMGQYLYSLKCNH